MPPESKLLLIFSTLFLLITPFVYSYPEHTKKDNSHMSKKHSITELNPQLSFEIALHGFLLWASMGFFMPVGILVIRMSNREECGRRLKIMFYIHATLQILSVLLATAGAIISIRDFENSFNNNHQRMGLVVYGIIWLQTLIGFLRPQRGSRSRSIWFILHWVLGTVGTVLGIISIYTGLQAYQIKISKSLRLWTIIFTVEIALIAFVYLFQDKWYYIQKQGVILGSEPIKPTDQEISPISKQRDTLAEPC